MNTDISRVIDLGGWLGFSTFVVWFIIKLILKGYLLPKLTVDRLVSILESHNEKLERTADKIDARNEMLVQAVYEFSKVVNNTNEVVSVVKNAAQRGQ